MAEDRNIEKKEGVNIAAQVKGAIAWRSGSQIVAQLVTWSSTFVVIRLLDPRDYGLYAMTQVVITFLGLMSGYGFANSLIRDERIDRHRIAQAFGMLILLNVALGLAQFLLAPLAAAYFRQPLVGVMLRVEALLFLAAPFIALPQALLARRLDFKRQARAFLTASCLSAATALGCALAGLGVWTLVAASIVLFWTQAICLTLAARSLMWPSFRFAGAGGMIRYGGAMVLMQLCWFVQSQSDVFIAGRTLRPYELGLYTTALFLTQILVAKFIPPLNDVAFAAYSRMQTDRTAVAAAFLKAVRLILLIALPFYFGLAVTAEPLVLTVLGPKWAGAVPLVGLLALAMPFMTLQSLFSPATNAIGRARTALRCALIGALILPVAFLVGIRFGTMGMVWAWLIGVPLFAGATIAISLPALGVRFADLVRAILPGLLASAAMALIVRGLDSALPVMAAQARLALLVATGMASYAGLLFLFARPLIEDVRMLLKRQPPAPAAV